MRERSAKVENPKKAKHAPSVNFDLSPDITLDARRAIWFSETKTLAVADLHLGYAWAHRHGGNLLPLSAREDSLERLLELVEFYAPRELIFLGDIVHRAVPVKALKDVLGNVINRLRERVELTLIAGNHDRNLPGLLAACGVPGRLAVEKTVGGNLLVHGDGNDSATAGARRHEIAAQGGRVIIGHEHPAITISDGVATSVKCPCFLVSEHVIILPAFSNWAAGSSVRSRRFMSPFAQDETFHTAFAVIAGKILPVRV